MRTALLALLVLLLVGALPAAAFPLSDESVLELRSYGRGSVAVADVNGDGLSDIAWTHFRGNRLYVHYQTAEGFAAETDAYLVLDAPSSLVASDLNGDGREDLVVLWKHGVQVYTQLTTTLLPATYTLTAEGGVDLAVGDMNGDTRQDVVLLTGTSVLLWLQDPRGDYGGEPVVLGGLEDYQALALGDVNGDFRTDLVIAKPWEIRVAYGAPQGNETNPRLYLRDWAGDRVEVAVGDVDGDGLADIVLADTDTASLSGQVTVWKRDASGDGYAPREPIAGPLTERLVLADLEDDGDLDVAVVRYDGNVNLYFQLGDGVLPPLPTKTLEGIDAGTDEVLTAGDVNGDTYTDLVLRGQASATLKIFEQDDLPPHLTGLPVPEFRAQEGGESEAWDLRAAFHDDHDALRFTVTKVDGPAVQAVLDGPRLAFRAGPGVYGRATFRVEATDGVAGRTPLTSDVLVDVNALPVVALPAAQRLVVGEALTLLLAIRDPYPADDRARLVIVDGPEGLTVDRDGTIRWSPAAEQAGVHGVTVIAQDSYGGTSAPLTFQVVVDPKPPAPLPLAPIAAGSALTAIALLGAGAAVNENVRWSFLLFFLPLYSKIKREEVLDHFVRGQIYGYILANPGEHYNAIKQALSLTNGSLAHHLKTLEREQFVKSRRFGLYRRFYPRDYRIPEGDAFVPNHIQRSLLDVIHAEPGLSQKEIAGRLGLTPPTVNYHVGLLEEHGHIRVVHAGRRTQLYAVEENGGGNGEAVSPPGTA